MLLRIQSEFKEQVWYINSVFVAAHNIYIYTQLHFFMSTFCSFTPENGCVVFFFPCFLPLLCLENRSTGYDITVYHTNPSVSLAGVDGWRGGGVVQ